MIARIFLFIVIGTLVPYFLYDRKRLRCAALWRRIVHWLPAVLLLGYSAYLSLLPGFVPETPLLVDVWFGMMALCYVPQFVYVFCTGIGWCVRRVCHTRSNRWGRRIGVVLAAFSVFAFIYGFTLGFRRLEVKHITVWLPNLPEAFDGYRIVQFSDIHLGSFYGWRADLPQRDIDSIQAQHPDMICFTGDLQNARPEEIYPFRNLLASLHAPDGVFSILGNHDYSKYIDADEQTCRRQEAEVRRLERSMGWRLLCNEQAVVHRGNDSIYVVGTENYDRPKHTEVAQSLYGIKPGNFVLMLQHIPKQWKDMVPSRINTVYGSPDSVLVAPQLTLSGHTHGGQISVLGLRPTLFSPFDYGLYEREGCQLYTSRGLGGVVPIRIGATAEIVVLTLRVKK